MSRLHRLAMVLALLTLASRPSVARYACAVVKTSDGFVSLREGPSTRHREIGKMLPHELVGLLHPDRDDIVRSGDWLLVRWYPGTRRTASQIPDVDETKSRTGWVRDKLLNCFEE
jgi:hypothetical protein